jgi:hypothetical protein
VFNSLGLNEQAGDTCLNISADYQNAQDYYSTREWLEKALDYYNKCVLPRNKDIVLNRLYNLKKNK